jgi:hypothetical protein
MEAASRPATVVASRGSTSGGRAHDATPETVILPVWLPAAGWSQPGSPNWRRTSVIGTCSDRKSVV